jgi:hypothetical protein
LLSPVAGESSDLLAVDEEAEVRSVTLEISEPVGSIAGVDLVEPGAEAEAADPSEAADADASEATRTEADEFAPAPGGPIDPESPVDVAGEALEVSPEADAAPVGEAESETALLEEAGARAALMEEPRALVGEIGAETGLVGEVGAETALAGEVRAQAAPVDQAGAKADRLAGDDPDTVATHPGAPAAFPAATPAEFDGPLADVAGTPIADTLAGAKDVPTAQATPERADATPGQADDSPPALAETSLIADAAKAPKEAAPADKEEGPASKA